MQQKTLQYEYEYEYYARVFNQNTWETFWDQIGRLTV